MKLKFSGRGITFLHHFKAKDDIRYYLNGIFFQPMPADAGGGVIGAATNGAALALWYDQDGHVDRTVIARITNPLVAACKKSDACLEAVEGRLAVLRYEEIAGGKVPVEEIHVQPNGSRLPRPGVPMWEVEGNFPSLIRVVQDREHYAQGPIGSFSAEYLGVIAAAVKAARPNRFAVGVEMRQHDKEGALMAVFPEIPEALAMIMPRRDAGLIGAPWLEAWRRHENGTLNIRATPLPGQQPSDAEPPPEFTRVHVPTGKQKAA